MVEKAAEAESNVAEEVTDIGAGVGEGQVAAAAVVGIFGTADLGFLEVDWMGESKTHAERQEELGFGGTG